SGIAIAEPTPMLSSSVRRPRAARTQPRIASRLHRSVGGVGAGPVGQPLPLSQRGVDRRATPTTSALGALPLTRLQRDEVGAGAPVGDYIVLSTIAVGACGTVHRAQHRLLGRPAALKILHADLVCSPEMLARFAREARTMSQLRHPNVVDVYDFGRLSDGRPYYVMELLEGISLDAYLQRQGGVEVGAALELLAPVVAALEAAHRAQVVHRDLNAGNVFLAEAGGRRIVKLLDFGVVKVLDGGAAV